MITAQIVPTDASGLASDAITPKEFPYVVILYAEDGQMIEWDVARSYADAQRLKYAMRVSAL